MTKKWIVFFSLCAVILFSAVISPQTAQANDKYASIVMDADTGMVLRERHADKKLYPASMTKIMTLYLTFEAIESGKISPNERIWISPHAASMVPSKLGLKPGSTIRVEDAIYALVTKSANDIAAALGEAVAGSEIAFGRKMTAKARELGMSNTTFKNASGLHDPEQQSTARDMARLSQALIHNFPRYYQYFSTQNFKYRGRSYRNHNGLMRSYEGMDGIKTGYISAAGFNLAASAKRNGHRLIGVVFGGYTAASRNAHMAKILDEGFAKVNSVAYAAAKNPPLPEPKPRAISRQTIQLANNGNNNRGGINGDFQMMGMVVGEGDYDDDATRQVMASVNSISRTDGGLRRMNNTGAGAGAIGTPAQKPENWAVQVGAFNDKQSSTQALREAAKKLPRQYVSSVQPQIITARSENSTVYRARFSGMSRTAAVESCRILKNCIVLSTQ